jgi:hypothetical protein
MSVKSRLFAAVSAVALAMLSAPAPAQHAGHHGAHPPAAKKAPAKKKPAAKKPAAKKPLARKAPAKKPAAKKAPAKKAPARKTPAATPTPPEPMVDHSKMDHGAPPVPAEPGPAAPVDHSQMDHGAMDHEAASAEHAGHADGTGALGPYPMTRESSGTAWQPDASEHMGIMSKAGDWDLMAHGVLNLVYDHQSGRRGDDMAFVSGMAMGVARRPVGNGTVQLRASLSPEPLMGKRGYPLLLASGETANGVDRLIDRQHPHDFFMELSASISQNVGPKSSVFLYAALPGEPAFGPPAFMHREAILDSPEAPITHHWLDSTHISFGVLTGGLVLDRIKAEVSRFNGREPDQHRWNIETAPLDSTAVRLSWNPTAELSLQGSWGRFIDPEQLEPGVDQTRWSASALYALEIAPGWKLAGTLAWGRKSIKDHHGDGLNDDAYVAEASLKHGSWTVFGRGEMTENRELIELDGEGHGPAFRVGKVSLGAVRDFKVAEHLSLGAGGLLAVKFVPEDIASLYGSGNPTGAMAFARLKVD